MSELDLLGRENNLFFTPGRGETCGIAIYSLIIAHLGMAMKPNLAEMFALCYPSLYFVF